MYINFPQISSPNLLTYMYNTMQPPETIPKSFAGCLPHKTLKLSLSRSRSRCNSNLSSPRNPMKSPGGENGSTSSRGSSSSSSTRSREEEEYREVFRRFDNDNDGKVSALGLRSYFASVGEYVSEEDAEAVIADLDGDGDNLIDFQDFLRLMKRNNNNNNNKEGGGGEEDLKAAFGIFELEKGCGRITPKSLQRVLSRLGDSKSYDECVAMIQVFDTHGKGEIGYPEFHEMMMHGFN